jgi:3-hydroxyacyl-CoA dehydrogenase
MDIVGIQTTYHISLARAEATKKNEMLIKIADLLKTNYKKKGKLGKETGEGFYKYTSPDVAIRSYDNGLMDKI